VLTLRLLVHSVVHHMWSVLFASLSPGGWPLIRLVASKQCQDVVEKPAAEVSATEQAVSDSAMEIVD